jgi:hypothetical protein
VHVDGDRGRGIGPPEPFEAGRPVVYGLEVEAAKLGWDEGADQATCLQVLEVVCDEGTVGVVPGGATAKLL